MDRGGRPPYGCPMRIAVVGATGNVGTAVLRRLHAAGASVVGVARRAPDASAAPYADVEWHALDVGLHDSRSSLVAAFAGADAVIDLAWALQSSHHERALYRTNVIGLQNVLAAARSAGVPQVVVASSVGAYRAAPKAYRTDEQWPTDGIRSSVYSSHKAIVERILDRFEADNPAVVVTRLRPGLVFQRDAGREIPLLFIGGLAPATALLRFVRPPVLPLPRSVVVQAVHADDLADAYWRAVERRARGAFNIAAEPVLDADAIAATLGARRVGFPLRLLRLLVWGSWHARLQRTDVGWLDIATGCPVMRTDRAREVLGWRPAHESTEALGELIDAMADRAGQDASPALRA
jgi:UDP-glucose 4-epimerase